jgi:predicted ester cyclase
MLHRGFPDLRITADDLFADEHSAVVRWTLTGTHRGTFAGIEPNGQPVRITGIDILRIERGKIVARWDEVNRHGLGTGRP